MNAKEKELADKLLKFGEVLEDLLPAGARVFPRLGLQPIRRLTGHIPIVDLEGERTSLSRKVSEVGRSIVVIVDDIDRLPPRDIRVIFQIIKAVAAFPRITYLLAFDPGPVDRALCFGRSRKGGKEFRDKIVQVNFPLPRIGYGTRKRFFVSRLNERIEFWRFLLQPYEERLRDDAIPLVLSALLTPSRNSGTGLVLLDVSESLNLKGPKVKVRHR
jgi:hypothetical protein